MKWGLLWFDDASDDLAAKVTRAVAAFVERYGTVPDSCYVHPSALGNGVKAGMTVAGVQVWGRRETLCHHFWVGPEEKDKRRRRSCARMGTEMPLAIRGELDERCQRSGSYLA